MCQDIYRHLAISLDIISLYMKFSDIEQNLSIPRIHRYLQITASKTRAVKLYRGNLKLARAFHPLLGVLEVTLRNRVYEAIALHFTNDNWIIREATSTRGFMSSPTLAGTQYYLRGQVRRTQRKLKGRGATITSGRIVAEQTFGFWTDLFEPHHFRLIGGSPMRAFTNLSPGKKRIDVATDLTKIRRFRNRINHNEPILLRAHSIDFNIAQDVYDSIIDVFNWMDPKLIKWIKSIDNVPRTLSACKRI